MAILPGRRLGPYEILSAIGAGGMGEVYKARDTRLDRIVAIKVLPAHLADRAELRERFDREAKTIASLNHPHICTLYDTGHQDDIDFLVMEYLEGETLAQRLQKGPLPLEQVLQYAIEISDALDKAHRKGVTHRDLKPGNIMLTKTGTKLLDFGLAKLKQEVVPANVPFSELPTAKDPLTAEGAIVGTLQYMAPEQLEGKEVDARTDIFAFGAVVYEMATCRKAFEGKTSASVMAKILEVDPPPMVSLQPMTPPQMDRVVKKCLAKESEKRWQTASDLCEELKWIAEGGSQAGVPAAAIAGGTRLTRRSILFSAVVSLIVAAVVGLAVWNLKPSPAPPPVSRSVFTLPPGQQLAGLENGPAVALSSDGTHLAYVARQGGTQLLYLRAMDSLESKPIPGTEGAVNPFFSPDGQWLGFFEGGRMKKVSVKGGVAMTLLGDALNPHGASWGSHGMIVYAAAPGASGLRQVSGAGGTPQALTRLEKGETDHAWPEFLPGDKAVLFAAGRTGGNWTNALVAVQSLGAGERQSLIQGGMHPRYAPSGHLVYAQGGSLMAVPFDSNRRMVTGAAVPVAEGVLQSQSTGAAQYSLSTTGSLVYVPGGVQATQLRLVWVSRNGAERPLPAPAHHYRFPRISPDGRRAAVAIEDQESQIWLYDLRETLTRLTFDGNDNVFPVWTPNGKRILFKSNKEGPGNLFWQLADGSGGLERLTTSEYPNFPSSWSPGGQLQAFVEVNPATGSDLWVLRMSDRKVQPFLRTPFNESVPRFSPDGRWLAYISNESGRFEIYVQPYPGPSGKWQISTEGGTEPVWNPNGRELFYRSGGKMMVVDIATQPSFTFGKPRMLFEGQYQPSPVPAVNYDVSPDGQRFLMLKPSESAEAAPTQINVVLNWFEELKQKVPTEKKP
jgi:Tol biopolymer transport system component/predicted Ser/Thr protein kinase